MSELLCPFVSSAVALPPWTFERLRLAERGWGIWALKAFLCCFLVVPECSSDSAKFGLPRRSRSHCRVHSSAFQLHEGMAFPFAPASQRCAGKGRCAFCVFFGSSLRMEHGALFRAKEEHFGQSFTAIIGRGPGGCSAC